MIGSTKRIHGFRVYLREELYFLKIHIIWIMRENEKKYIFRHIKKHYMGFALLLLGVAGASVVGLLYALITAQIVNQAFYEKNVDGIVKYLIIFIVVYIVHQAFHFLKTYSAEKLNASFSVEIKEEILESVLYLKGTEYSKLTVGDVLKRMGTDADGVLRFLYLNVIYYITDFVEFFIQLVFIAFISIPVLILTLICMPLSFYLTRAFVEKSKHHYKTLISSESKLSTYILEVIQNLQELRMLNGFHWMKNRFADYNKQNNWNIIKTKKCELENQQIVNGLSLIIHIALYVLTAWLIIHNNLKFGSFLAVLEYFDASITAFSEIVGRGNPIAQDFASINRIIEVLDLEHENIEVGEEMEIQKGDIRIENCSFRYGNNVKAIDNCSLHIESGGRVAIVGMNGSGKTTLVYMLLKLYENQEGNIYIDNINLRDISLECLRKQIAIVNQQVIIFNGSVRYNILLKDNNEEDDKVWEYLEMVGLKEYVRNLPNQLDTIIGTMGAALSTGQSQRIGIARALTRDAKIVIFDESTASLDAETEQIIINTWDQLSKQKTLIIIAHELKTIKKAERVVFMNNGKIISVGSHEYQKRNCPEYVELLL